MSEPREPVQLDLGDETETLAALEEGFDSWDVFRPDDEADEDEAA